MRKQIWFYLTLLLIVIFTNGCFGDTPTPPPVPPPSTPADVPPVSPPSPPTDTPATVPSGSPTATASAVSPPISDLSDPNQDYTIYLTSGAFLRSGRRPKGTNHQSGR